jgi:hypothetical protein
MGLMGSDVFLGLTAVTRVVADVVAIVHVKECGDGRTAVYHPDGRPIFSALANVIFFG